MSKELKPCPFCGGIACIYPVHAMPNFFDIMCNDCCVSTDHRSEEGAIKDWNARAKPTFTKEDVEKALLAISEVHSDNREEGELIVKAALNAVGRVEE